MVTTHQSARTYSAQLQQRIDFLRKCSQAVDAIDNPAILYIAAWHDRDQIIWYEYTSQNFQELLDCEGTELMAPLFRESVLEHRAYRFNQTDVSIEQQILVKEDLGVARERLRSGGEQAGTTEAVYKIRLARGEELWLKDHARIEFHSQDGIYLSVGCLTDVTKEMQAEAQLKRIETSLQAINKELAIQVSIDGLTQIANRRYFDLMLKREWKRLRWERESLSLILCDVDYFKAYNDTYGHQAGDDCLRCVADAISCIATRPADVAARYGGEEFAIILPRTPASGAASLAETLRRRILDLEIEHNCSAAASVVTISIGVATVAAPWQSAERASPDILVERADTALYAAKKQGRNRVVCYWDLIE